ncbi:hypothetical protein J6590_095466 [Homalodisca vitripennis]|nr:hypothetical protein J6590_095466 [Homalodisca vitripennis]
MDSFVYRSDRDAETSGKCRGGGVLLAVNKRLHARRLSGQRRQLIADTLCVKVAAPPPHSHHALYINVVYFPPNNKRKTRAFGYLKDQSICSPIEYVKLRSPKLHANVKWLLNFTYEISTIITGRKSAKGMYRIENISHTRGCER